MSKHKKKYCTFAKEFLKVQEIWTSGRMARHIFLSTCISSLVNCKKAFVFDSLTGEANGNFLNS